MKERPSLSQAFRHQVRREVLGVNGVLISLCRPHNLNAWNRLRNTKDIILFTQKTLNYTKTPVAVRKKVFREELLNADVLTTIKPFQPAECKAVISILR